MSFTQQFAMMAVFAAVLFLSACNRDPAPMTKCVGDAPATPRIHDAAPPNCSKI